MTTTTLNAFWDAFATQTEEMILGNQNFWVVMAQAILIISLISVLFIAFRRAARKIFR